MAPHESSSSQEGFHTIPALDECEELLKSSPTEQYQFTQSDIEYCEQLLKKGSSSFWASSLLLPAKVRQDIIQIYSFCRIADDLIDESGDPVRAMSILRHRLDRIYNGVPCDHPMDRAFADVTLRCGIPKIVPEMLLEGFQWDAEQRQYNTLEEMVEYCVRVASTVGVMTTIAMGVSDYETLARACDLGIGFQMTNIARDVGEDARNGRVYLPSQWLEEVGLSRESLLKDPKFSPELAKVVDRLLQTADRAYLLSDEGIPKLPLSCQLAIRAARNIYSDIGNVVRYKNGLDSVSSRAKTGGKRKLFLAFCSLGQTILTFFTPSLSSPSPRAVFVAPQAAPLIQKFKPASIELKFINFNLAEPPMFQVEHVGKLQYLKAARQNGDLGLVFALIIISAWMVAIFFGLTTPITLENAPFLIPLFFLEMNLYCGIFITAHDAMHGIVCPSNKALNNFIGSLCVHLYAMFDYKLLLKSHWDHHRKPASESDPDHHDGVHTSALAWYFRFMISYMTLTQLVGMSIVFNALHFVIGIPFENLMLFFVVPALLSSFQLFYFGTYLPHKEPEDGFPDKNRSTSSNFSTLWSFLTCYHFGYHWEHHEYPYIPWWRLPEARRKTLAAQHSK